MYFLRVVKEVVEREKGQYDFACATYNAHRKES